MFESENFLLTLIGRSCHSRAGGNPVRVSSRKNIDSWIPAFAGMTEKGNAKVSKYLWQEFIWCLIIGDWCLEV